MSAPIIEWRSSGTLALLSVVLQLAVPIDATESAISPGIWLEYSTTS